MPCNYFQRIKKWWNGNFIPNDDGTDLDSVTMIWGGYYDRPFIAKVWVWLTSLLPENWSVFWITISAIVTAIVVTLTYLKSL
jgi:hypothetical protein